MSSQNAGSSHRESARLSLAERLALVYQRLDKLPVPTTADETLTQLSVTLEEVEDEFSSVPKDPNPGLRFDGRMYPPREDFIERDADGGLVAITKRNIIRIWPNGSMVISSKITGEEYYRRGWPPADETGSGI
ncbi:hypothetical protein [Streptomyces sp. NBC_00724]|uniref:hypothetical protein n=1 Tax=Streptomyces sp. NBC_00724 TaxID=2975812 RepID=UPI002ED068FD|nr:hypothetical protein OHB17_42095 [Streptomyces sp. NBC_00724]